MAMAILGFEFATEPKIASPAFGAARGSAVLLPGGGVAMVRDYLDTAGGFWALRGCRSCL